jgi:hypothetical protein
MRAWLWVTVLVAFVAGCDKPKALPTEQVEGAQTEAANHEQRFAAMSAKDRLGALEQLALAGEKAELDVVEAWLKAAQNDAERAALKQAARPRFATQYALLLAQKQKPSHVAAGGTDGTTLSVRGDHCSKFLLEDFVGSRDAKTAKLVGFVALSCESKALALTAEL